MQVCTIFDCTEDGTMIDNRGRYFCHHHARILSDVGPCTVIHAVDRFRWTADGAHPKSGYFCPDALQDCDACNDRCDSCGEDCPCTNPPKYTNAYRSDLVRTIAAAAHTLPQS